MKKEMLINARGDECRIAVVADGTMTELYVEQASSLSQVGNIYKGRVTNVEPSIQAAFVDFGTPKNGFLHISDLHPHYFPDGQQQSEAVGKKIARRERPPIQACLRRGQEVIAQVTKDGIGTKGATLTTYISIPGRYLVLMPGMHRLGVSRKIEDETVRARVRTILEELKPPPDLGFIVRTAGMDRAKHDLQRDLNYLMRLWKAVEQRGKESHTPAEIYQESDLVIRTIRDIFNSDIRRIVCDDEGVACKIKEFLRLIMPRTSNLVELYLGDVGLFHSFGLEEEIENIHSPRVALPAGGSLVIDQTEAMVAIDVNSGRFRQTDNAETMAVRINTEAAREAARQLRLRDLGGVIVIDFIDMMDDKHRRSIEKILREEVKKDRARTKILRMSRFGIVEMTRQRVKPSIANSLSRPCPHCNGSGRIRSDNSQALTVMRTLHLAASDERFARIDLTAAPAVADHLLNHHRQGITKLEETSNTRILVHADADLPVSKVQIDCIDAGGSTVQWDAVSALPDRPKKVPTREITCDDLAAFRKRQRPGDQAAQAAGQDQARQPDVTPETETKPEPETKAKKPRRRRRRRRKKTSGSGQDKVSDNGATPDADKTPETANAGEH